MFLQLFRPFSFFLFSLSLSLSHLLLSAMVELRSVSALCGCRVLAKLEHLLPSGSVKDRAALAMIDDAAAQGHTHIVEGV